MDFALFSLMSQNPIDLPRFELCYFWTEGTMRCTSNASYALSIKKFFLFSNPYRIYRSTSGQFKDLRNTSNNSNSLVKSVSWKYYSWKAIHFYVRHRIGWSRDSVVGIATGYGLDDQEVGVRVTVGSRIFSSPRRPDRLWGTPNLLSNGYWGSSPGVKRPRREADHSPSPSTEVKKIWIYTLISPYTFMA
jgi:hypothetical protein